MSGTKTESVDFCDYSTWPKVVKSDAPKTSDPPYPVPTGQTVSRESMTCNDPKTNGIYDLQSIMHYAQQLYTDASRSALVAKPTSSNAIDYSGGWTGYKFLKTNLEADEVQHELDGSQAPERRWLALSIQYLKSACEDGDDGEVSFTGYDGFTGDDLTHAFVLSADNCVGAEYDQGCFAKRTPGGTLNWRCLQWKLHSLDMPPPYHDDGRLVQHFRNGTLAWNGTLSWNETASVHSWNGTLNSLWGGTTFGAYLTASAVVAGQKD